MWSPFNFKAVYQSTCLIFPTNAAYNVQRWMRSSETLKFKTAKRKTSGKSNNCNLWRHVQQQSQSGQHEQHLAAAQQQNGVDSS